MSQWIDKLDRLPSDGQFFLGFGPGLGAHIHGPTIEVCRWDGDLWSEGGTELESYRAFTHWMPLPDPPSPATQQGQSNAK